MSSGFPSLAHSSQTFPLPSIAEDALDYTIHLPPPSTVTATSTSDEQTTSTSTSTSALALLISDYVQSLLVQPWLWNKDSWELKVVSENGENGEEGGRLAGRMRVGDAVDDEWLVVYLLREVSKRWRELIIGIRDTDGEFLLIEAANVLPSWVTPENSTNRLWLKNGQLHLIPLSIRSAPPKARQIPDDEEEERFDPDAWISEEDAMKAVRTGKYREESLESAVWERIASYPDGLKTHLHLTKAWLPVPIAKALRTSPELVQKAVEGFYVRDPSQLRAASRMTHFPPSPAVLTPVLLTRAAYAQLQGQVFHPPRIFGPEWQLPEGGDKDDERRWRDLGVKISTGFEIMYREGGRKGRNGRPDGDEVKDTEDYRTFLTTLTKAGYFKGELEGSAKWQEREAEAYKGYRSAKSSDSAPERPSFAFQVDNAIKAAPTSSEDLKVPPSYQEDDDKWLEVSPEEVDAMLAARSGAPAGGNTKNTDGEVAEGDERGQALSDLAKKVEDFVGGKGDMEGARFADELSDEDMGDSDDDDEELEDTAAVREEKMRNLVPALPAEEWGRKTPITSAAPAKMDAKAVKKVTIADPKTKNSDDKPIKMRPPVFEPQEYDGVVSESDDSGDDEPARAGSLGKILGDMKWADMGPQIEDLDGEDEADLDKAARYRSRKFGLGDDIDEAMKRRVWGDNDGPEDDGDEDEADEDMEFDPDMEAEQGDFFKFAQEALGLSEEQMQGIVSSREARGAFVPTPATTSSARIEEIEEPAVKTKSTKRPPVSNTPTPPVIPPATAGEGEMNMNLDSFEKVMAAMDAELAKVKASKRSKPSESVDSPAKEAPSTTSTTKVKPQPPTQQTKKPPQQRIPTLPTEDDLDDFDDDDLLAMDRELKAALKSAGVNSDDEEDDDDRIEEVGELDEEGKREYKMMKDFLESYKSQGGGSGVVGNLFGRLGENRR